MATLDGSIVDYLNSIGQPSDFTSRAALAAKNGIPNYTGTAAQNTQLLGKVSTTSPTSTTTAPMETLSGATYNAPAYGVPQPTATLSINGGALAPTTNQPAGGSPQGIPSSVYQSYGQLVLEGLDPQKAIQQLQSFINDGTYTGQVDKTQLFSPSITVPGVNAKFDNTGSGSTIKPNATVISETANANGVSSSTSTAAGGALQGVAYDPSFAKYGITQDVWNSLSTTQQGIVGAAMGAASSLYSTTGSKVSLDQALKVAATDPNIVAKYSDAAKLDTQNFQQTIQQLQVAASTNSQTLQMQFEAERKALAEQSAAAGQAYSGFRGLAQQNLSQSESGIVTSTRSQLQKQLDDATSSFESKYGTAATNPASISFVDPFASSGVSASGQDTTGNANPSTLSGTLAGSITGSQPVAKQQDINTLAGQYVTLGQTPNVIAA